MANGKRLFLKVTRESIPQVKDKYPFLYLERGRLEIDDSSAKWIDSTGNVISLPVATINCLLLGPGTSVTHEAIKACSSANCSICWVGEDSLIFYAAGLTPTSDSRNMRKQFSLHADPDKSIVVARRFYAQRFPDAQVKDKDLKELMGMEGSRVRALYERKADEYGLIWRGRNFKPGNFEISDLTNQVLSAVNAALYGILCSAVHSLGYSPHAGFIHSGSPLPFIYDLSDLYKDELCIDLALSLTREMAGEYNKHKVSEAFREKVMGMKLLEKIPKDINQLLNDVRVSRNS
jgi:CRISPR-associated protein Cas1